MSPWAASANEMEPSELPLNGNPTSMGMHNGWEPLAPLKLK